MSKQTLIEIARECGNLRRKGDPESVIIITEDVIASSEKQKKEGYDRILCTRGGAFRDLGKSTKALECAEEAIRINEKYNAPFRLAGACCIDLGMIEKGQDYFNEAAKRGIPKREIEKSKRSGEDRRQQSLQKNFKAPSRYPYEDYGFDFEHELQQVEQAMEKGLIDEELEEYRDSMESSNEDGWFYKD